MPAGSRLSSWLTHLDTIWHDLLEYRKCVRRALGLIQLSKAISSYNAQQWAVNNLNFMNVLEMMRRRWTQGAAELDKRSGYKN